MSVVVGVVVALLTVLVLVPLAGAAAVLANDGVGVAAAV